MGVLDKFESSFVNTRIKLPERIDNKEDAIPEIKLEDTRILLPTRADNAVMGKLMLAHVIEDYRKSKSAITLLPEVDIAFEKIIIDREPLMKVDISLVKVLQTN